MAKRKGGSAFVSSPSGGPAVSATQSGASAPRVKVDPVTQSAKAALRQAPKEQPGRKMPAKYFKYKGGR